MKVSGIGGPAGPSETRKTGKTEKGAPGAFAKHLSSSADAESVDEAGLVEGPAAVGGIDALLATQAVDDSLGREQRRRLISYGETLLDQLNEVRHGLLLGSIPQSRLIALARQMRERREIAADPRLAVLLDEIELRVQVELAKLAQKPAS